MADDTIAKPFPDQPTVVGSGGRALTEPEESAYDDYESQLCAKMVANGQDAYRYWNEIYDQCDEDVAFIYDEQWDEKALAQREAEERPALTLNFLPTHINLVTGGIRKNRFDIKVIRRAGLAEDGIVSLGGQTYSNADIMGGMIRDIQSRSMAFDQYINASQHAAEGGFGWLRVKKVRPEDDPGNVELRVVREQNRYSVMIDPQSTMIDHSDMRWAIVSVCMAKRDFETRYPEEDSKFNSGHPEYNTKDSDLTGFGDWWTNHDKDQVRVIEYWWREPVKRTIVHLMRREEERFERMDVWEDEVEDVLDELETMGWIEDPERDREELDTDRVMVCHMTHKRILEEPVEWEGCHIPIVMVRGRTVDYDGKTHYLGLTHFAKDAQSMTNYWATAATERVALAPKDGWVLSAQQIQGHEKEWESGGPPLGYRTYNQTGMEGEHIPIREEPPPLPSAELSLVGIGRDSIKDTVGLHDANLGRPSNEVSGAAIRNRQAAGMTATYDYPDNLASALTRLGKILVDLIPRVYTGQRVQRIVMEDEESTADVVLNQVIKDRQSGKNVLVAAIGLARYDVTVKPGPSFASQREEMVAMLTELGKNNPQAIQPILHLIVQGMDIPYGGEVTRILKGLVPRHLLSEEDRRKLPPPEPTPGEKIAQMEQQGEMAKAKAVEAKAASDLQIAQTQLQAAQEQVKLRELQVAEQQLQNEREEVLLEKARVELEKAKVEKARTEEEGSEEEVERRARRQAADKADPKSLP